MYNGGVKICIPEMCIPPARIRALGRHPLPLFLVFPPLVVLKEMAVESEPTNEESSAGVIEECVLWTRLGESGPPDSTTQIFCMLTVQLENLGLQVSVDGLMSTALLLLSNDSIGFALFNSRYHVPWRL